MLREKVLSLVLFLVLGFITFASNPSIAKASPNPVVPNGQLGEFRHGTYPSPPLGDFTHPGVDLAAPCGSDIFSLADGTVKDVIDSKSDRNFDSLGYMVIIEHPAQSLLGMDKTFYTLYLHMQDPPDVKIGDQVGGRGVIGNVGQTGKTIGGCHTHFEVRYFPGRFPEWGNIFGPGDKRKSMYFQQFWEDPVALFSKTSQGMAQAPTPEKPLEERVQDILKDFLENKTFSFESALAGVKKEYKRIEALGPEKEAKIQSLLSGFDLIGVGIYKQRAYDSDAKAHLHNIYLACKALWVDTDSSNPCSVEVASRENYGFSQSSKVSIEIMRGAETNFLAKARHEEGGAIFQINYAGNIESIGSTGIKPEKVIINTANKILAIDPANFWGHSALANAYLEEGNIEQGFSHLIKGMHQIPSHPLPYFLLVGYKSELIGDSGDKSLAEKLGQKLKAMGEEGQFFLNFPPDPETLKASADEIRAKILAEPFGNAVKNGQIEEVKRLLGQGAEINTKIEAGYHYTALSYTAFKGHTDIAKLLIEKGADVNAKEGEYGSTALMWAAGQGHTDIVKLLIDKGADVNAENKNGGTALMWAAEQGHTDIVKLLIDKGADVNAENKDGDTALTYAIPKGYDEIARLLISKGAVSPDPVRLKRLYDSPTKSNLHNLYLACKALWADTSSSNSCSLEKASGADYGFIQSRDVEIKVVNSTETDFLVMAWHKKGEKVFLIEANGNISESTQKVPQVQPQTNALTSSKPPMNRQATKNTSGVTGPLPEHYGVYLVDNGRLIELEELEVTIRGSLSMGAFASGLSSIPRVEISDNRPVFILFNKNVDLSAFKKLAKLKFVRSIEGFDFYTRTSKPVKVDVWDADKSFSMYISPIEEKKDAYRLTPSEPLEPGVYAFPEKSFHRTFGDGTGRAYGFSVIGADINGKDNNGIQMPERKLLKGQSGLPPKEQCRQWCEKTFVHYSLFGVNNWAGCQKSCVVGKKFLGKEYPK